MAINLTRIGHCAIQSKDIEKSKQFYTKILGFTVVEQEPGHNGVAFMALPNSPDAHAIDLFPAQENSDANGGMHHIAFKVASDDDLKNAYFTLKNNNITILKMIDHVSQRSIYFKDPDGVILEIYHERPNAKELFLNGRGDNDKEFSFED